MHPLSARNEMEAPLGDDDVDDPLKMYFIPFPAPGHMNAHCELARLFASRGHHVTIVTTPSNSQTIRNSIPNAPNFHIQTVPFPSQVLGLPDGIESLSTGCSEIAYLGKVNRAITLLREPIEHLVEQHPPDCLVADIMFDWVEHLANKLQISRLTFNSFCLFAICAIKSLIKEHPGAAASSLFVIEGLPHRFNLKAQPPPNWKAILDSKLDVQIRSHGVIINNFAELDGEEYIRHYEKTTGHKAWHLGPASLLHRTESQKAERGHKSVVSVHECMSWLDTKGQNSVLYISFGSLCLFPDKQLYEIACALEASGCEFIWVVLEKKGKKESEDEEAKHSWLPEGFEERNIGNKGMIIRGWAPQVPILGHPAVGAFLTHCGWNSTVEAVSAGVPMITWPVHGEQFYNEKLITELRGIGVELGAEEWTSSGLDTREKLVRSDSIEKAVRRLMDGGDEAHEIRQRAQQFATKAKAAVQQGGSSYQNLTALIDQLKRLRDSKLVE